jgi:hypothetical protein
MSTGSPVRVTWDGHPSEPYTLTRRALHAVAELVMAGPEYRSSGTIRLRAHEGGITTVKDPALAVTAADGLLRLAGAEFPIEKPATTTEMVTTTCAWIAARAGVEPGAPQDLYHDGSGVAADDDISFSPRVVESMLDRLTVGNAALAAFAPAETPVLWPEHLDLGVTLDEVNYGVSLGDSFLDYPYAYVGPWKSRTGDFWNAPFGAARPLSTVEDAVAFFQEGRRQSSAT